VGGPTRPLPESGRLRAGEESKTPRVLGVGRDWMALFLLSLSIHHIGATTIDPTLLTAAERLQYEGYLGREETNAAILALSKSGIPIKQSRARLAIAGSRYGR
jgi:hypothetical protein